MMTICFLCVCVYVCLVGKCACLVVVAYVVHYARGAGPPMSSDTTHADHPTTQLNLQLNHAPTYPGPIMRAKPSVVCLCVCVRVPVLCVSTIAIHPFYVHASAYSLVFIRCHNGDGGNAAAAAAVSIRCGCGRPSSVNVCDAMRMRDVLTI